MALQGTKLWSVGEVVTASNMNTYMGPPPDLVDINVFPAAVSQTNWDSLNVIVGTMGASKASTGAQNAEINWDVVLAAGTWKLSLIIRNANDQGIYTVQLSTDGSIFTSVGSSPYNASASTIDAYTVGATYDNRPSLTSITIATTGRYRLKLLMATKNASSSGYAAQVQHVQLLRTG